MIKRQYNDIQMISVKYPVENKKSNKNSFNFIIVEIAANIQQYKLLSLFSSTVNLMVVW